MLLTPHTLVGIAIASVIPNPFLAVPISILSHFVGDLVPHWDFFTRTTREERKNGWRMIAILADFGLGIAIGIFFTLRALWVLHNPVLALSTFLCGVGAVLPDALEAPYIFMNKTPFGLNYLVNIQRKLQTPASFTWGVLTQVIIVLFSLYLLLY